jgi:N-methylhydantoinase A
MIAFGGAAPLHAGRLCEKLGVDRLLVPPGAGVGSAIGFLRAPYSFEANRSVYMRLTEFAPDTIRALLANLEIEATEFVRSCDATAEINAEFKVYMRYAGQGWEIPVQLTPAQAQSPDHDTFKQLFEDEYQSLFGRTVDGMVIEITVWAVNASTPVPASNALAPIASTTETEATATRSLFDPALSRSVNAAIVERRDFLPGGAVSGPALIVEDETTIVVPTSRQARVQSDGCIDITRTNGSV